MREASMLGQRPLAGQIGDEPLDDEDAPWSRLSAREQERLVTILDQYMIDEEEGRRVDIELLLTQNADLRGPLQHYLTGLQLVRELVPPFTGSAPNLTHLAALKGRSFINSQASRLGPYELGPYELGPYELGPYELGPYELGDTIGRGAMGIVYRAYDRSRQRQVAVKVLSFGTIVDPQRIDRFRREAQTAAQLDHPNLVPVYAVGCDRGINYYAMQLIEGDSLDRWLHVTRRESWVDGSVDPLRSDPQPGNPLSRTNRFRRIAQLLATAARALHAAHLAGVVHRDVKPSNLLLGRDGQIWITDFGLARVQAQHALTHTGELVGTVRYMSPEQAKGQNEQIDARADVYGLGATLYELTTLTPPFAGEDMMELLRRIQSEEPPLPSLHCADLPRDLETIILRAMRPRCSDRYPTAAAFADDLQRFVAGQPIQAQSVTFQERFTSWISRHRSLTSALLVAWCCLLVSSIATTVLVMRAQASTIAALKRSEGHYRQARSILDALGSTSARRLADIPAADAVRQDILAQTIGYYEKFIASSVSDPLLQHDVARTRFEIARLTALSSDYDSAERAFRVASQALFALTGAKGQGTPGDGKIPDGENDSLANVLLYVHILNDWALLNSAHGDQAEAQERLRQALKMLEGSHAVSTDNQREFTLAKALSLNNIGVIELRQGLAAQSAEHLQQAIALMETVPIAVVRLSPMGADLADAFSNLSALLGNAKRFSEAAQAAEQSLAMRLATHPEDVAENQSRSAVTYNNWAAFLWQSHRCDEAIAAYHRSVDLLEEVILHAPGQIEPQRRLAITLNNLGMALASHGSASQAMRAFERAEELTKPTVAAAPGDAEAARRLATILNNHAVVLRGEKREAEAEQKLRKAAELIEGFDNNPQEPFEDHPKDQNSLSIQIHENLDELNGALARESLAGR